MRVNLARFVNTSNTSKGRLRTTTIILSKIFTSCNAFSEKHRSEAHFCCGRLDDPNIAKNRADSRWALLEWRNTSVSSRLVEWVEIMVLVDGQCQAEIIVLFMFSYVVENAKNIFGLFYSLPSYLPDSSSHYCSPRVGRVFFAILAPTPDHRVNEVYL